MKKLFYVFFALTLALAVASCAKEYDDTELKGKVDKLTEEVNTLKANQQAMQAIIDVWKAGGYIQSIDNSVPGQHTITFYGENGKTVVLYDGVDGEDGEDGAQGPQGPQGEAGDSFFKSITTDENGVTFEKIDGTKIFIPFAKAFKLVIENPEAEVEAGTAVEFPYTVQNANESTTVDVFAGGNYAATVNATDKKIVVTPPTPAANGSVLAWAQNEEGLFSMRKLNFFMKAEMDIQTAVEDYQGISKEGGEVLVNIVSNVDIIAPQPDVDWVTVNLTKANYKLTLTLTENTTGEPREAIVKINRADNGKQVQEIKIIQLATEKVLGPLDSNVKWTAGDNSYDKVKTPSTGANVLNVTYGGELYEMVDHLKMGTAKAAGKAVLHLKKGTAYVSFWAAGWKGYDGEVKIVELDQTISIPKNEGVSGTVFNLAVADEDRYGITLPAPLDEDTDVNIETTTKGLRVVLFGIMASDEAPAPVVKETKVEKVWEKISTETEAWNSYFGGTAGTDRNVAIDNKYVYIAEFGTTKKIWAIDIADPSKVTAVANTTIKSEGFDGSIYLSCPRVVKKSNGDPVLIVSNLSTGAIGWLYAYEDGIAAEPKAIKLDQYEAGRRLGDTFTTWGNYENLVMIFGSHNGNGFVTFQLPANANNVSGLWSRFALDLGGMPAYYPFPDNVAKGIYAVRGEARDQFATVADITNDNVRTLQGAHTITAKKLNYSAGMNGSAAGYNFIEFNGKRYVIYGKETMNTKKGQLLIREGELTTPWETILGVDTVDADYASAFYTDSFTGGMAASNSAVDVAIWQGEDEVYIAIDKQKAGLVLYRMYAE